jgi:thiol-disulfide isomerase/thioredoxin
VEQFGGRVKYAVENYGESALAKRFGIKRYPALFVGDVLIATPKDFGFYGTGEGEGAGRYAPFPSEKGEELFRADVAKVVTLLLHGQDKEARSLAASTSEAPGGPLPRAGWKDLDGHPIAPSDLAGKVVAVEFWATWCPPCRASLEWLGRLQRQYGDRLVILTVAVQSDLGEVRALAADLHSSLRWTMATPDLAGQLGDVSAVPTLLLFDRDGKRITAHYGAPPDLHPQAEAELARLLR